MGREIRVSIAQGLDVPKNFIDVLNFLKDVPNLFKDVPRVPKSIPRWGMPFNYFPRVPKGSNGA